MGKYGWTARQYARVNARRVARGQEPLDIGQVGPNWMDTYTKEYSTRTGKSAFEENPEKPKRRFPETDEDETQVASAPKYKIGDFRMKPVQSAALDRMKEQNRQLEAERMQKRARKGPILTGRMGGMVA